MMRVRRGVATGELLGKCCPVARRCGASRKARSRCRFLGMPSACTVRQVHRDTITLHLFPSKHVPVIQPDPACVSPAALPVSPYPAVRPPVAK